MGNSKDVNLISKRLLVNTVMMYISSADNVLALNEYVGRIMGIEFNAQDVLLAVRTARAVRQRRSTWGKSKLNKYLTELLQLKQAGASYADMEFWLRKEKRLKTDRSNIKRFMDKQLFSIRESL